MKIFVVDHGLLLSILSPLRQTYFNITWAQTGFLLKEDDKRPGEVMPRLHTLMANEVQLEEFEECRAHGQS